MHEVRHEVRHEFSFEFDVPFIKNALRRDLLWRGYLAAGLLLAIAGLMRLWYGLWSPAVTGILAVDALWRKQSPGGRIRYELDDEGFSVLLEESRSRHRWQGLRRLWRYPDVWLIEIVKMQSAFFPPEQVPEETLEYIAERCRAAGVRV